MKKFIIISLITCASLTNSNCFGMLVQKSIAYRKKSNVYCTTNKLSLALLVQNRRQIKDRNNNLIELMTEQNKIINQLNKSDRPIIYREGILENNTITTYAQRLLELELALEQLKQQL